MMHTDYCPACKSHDPYDCWALRYFGHTDVSGMQVDEDGGPCECPCHDSFDEHDEYAGAPE